MSSGNWNEARRDFIDSECAEIIGADIFRELPLNVAAYCIQHVLITLSKKSAKEIRQIVKYRTSPANMVCEEADSAQRYEVSKSVMEYALAFQANADINRLPEEDSDTDTPSLSMPQ